jgi:hypothetical protein
MPKSADRSARGSLKSGSFKSGDETFFQLLARICLQCYIFFLQELPRPENKRNPAAKGKMHAPTLAGSWKQVRVRSSESTRVEFQFYPEYARVAWLSREPTAATRSAADPFEDERLLLQDTIYIENAAVHVNAYRVPAKIPNHYHLRLDIIAPQKFTRTVRVILRWGERHEYKCIPLRSGQILFQDISPPDFSHYANNMPSHDLSIGFEFDNSGKNGKH